MTQNRVYSWVIRRQSDGQYASRYKRWVWWYSDLKHAEHFRYYFIAWFIVYFRIKDSVSIDRV